MVSLQRKRLYHSIQKNTIRYERNTIAHDVVTYVCISGTINSPAANEGEQFQKLQRKGIQMMAQRYRKKTSKPVLKHHANPLILDLLHSDPIDTQNVRFYSLRTKYHSTWGRHSQFISFIKRALTLLPKHRPLKSTDPLDKAGWFLENSDIQAICLFGVPLILRFG